MYRPLLHATAACLMACLGYETHAASHREAPLIALDPAADLTDVYAFVSYDAANLQRGAAERRVTFIMNVNPGQNPAAHAGLLHFHGRS